MAQGGDAVTGYRNHTTRDETRADGFDYLEQHHNPQTLLRLAHGCAKVCRVSHALAGVKIMPLRANWPPLPTAHGAVVVAAVRALLLLLLLMVVAATAFAQGDVIPKVNDSCPSGYRNGPGAYCYQNSYGTQRDAVEKVGGKCPSGYSNGSGTYCYENRSSQPKDVVVKVDGRCPSGYRDGPGAYCYR